MQINGAGGMTGSSSPTKLRDSPNILKGQANIQNQNYAYLIQLQEMLHVDQILTPGMSAEEVEAHSDDDNQGYMDYPRYRTIIQDVCDRFQAITQTFVTSKEE